MSRSKTLIQRVTFETQKRLLIISMTHVITSLCLRDNGCVAVCPVKCIYPGEPSSHWPTFFIDPTTCTDCGSCVPECPFDAIFPLAEVPGAYLARGGEYINQVGLTGRYEGYDHHGNKVALGTVRLLAAGEMVDLRASIKETVMWSCQFLGI